MAKGLCEREQSVLDYIKRHITERGFPPAIREIVEHTEIKSTSDAHRHLRRLEAAGHLERTPGLTRAMRVLG